MPNHGSIINEIYDNHETVNKATCRMPSVNPRQLWEHLLKSFRTGIEVFRIS